VSFFIKISEFLIYTAHLKAFKGVYACKI